MIPIHKTIQPLLKNFKGNFGLWFNKFIELSEKDGKYKPENNAIVYYKKKYDYLKNNASNLLKYKHLNQIKFCMEMDRIYEKITITARLVSPLIVGIGQTHPNEVGMTFDHTIGIPYIPASGIKGVVRLSYILAIILNESGTLKNEFKDEEKISLEKTDIPEIFGGDKSIGNKIETLKGNVIFLDAYPLNIPELYVDIMNPHYGDYYSDDKNKKPPADYLNPNPIKFLAVAKGTEFIFRLLVLKSIDEKIKEKFKKAFERAIECEGIGAKTALGYGLFEIINKNEPNELIEEIKLEQKRKIDEKKELEKKKEEEKLTSMSKIEKICFKLENKADENYANEIYKKINGFKKEEKVKVANALKNFWIKIGKWDGKLSKKQKEKKKKIKQIINENAK